MADYIIADPKSGRLSFRRPYPAELRPFVLGQRRELKVSLKGTSLKEPEALERYKLALADYEQIVAQARRRQTGKFDALDAPTIAFLAKVFERDWFLFAQKQMEERGSEFAERAKEGWRWMPPEYRDARVDNDLEAMEEFWGRSAEALIAQRGLLLSSDDHDSFLLLCKMCILNSAVPVSNDMPTRIERSKRNNSLTI